MSARREQIATDYTSKQLLAHEEFIKSVGEYEHLLRDLFDMYTPIGYIYHHYTPPKVVAFTIHEYENCGATFGYHLIIHEEKGIGWVARLKTYLESGYQEGNTILVTPLNQVEKITQGFGPKRYRQE